MSIQAEMKDLQERVSALELLANGDALETRKAYDDAVKQAHAIASIAEDNEEQENKTKRTRK